MRSTPCSDGTRWSRERPAGSAPTSPVSWPARGAGLTLVARREDRLRALERELVDRHGATVDVAVLDLTADGAPEELRRRVADAGRPTCWSTTPATASTAGSSSSTGSASETCWSWT